MGLTGRVEYLTQQLVEHHDRMAEIEPTLLVGALLLWIIWVIWTDKPSMIGAIKRQVKSGRFAYRRKFGSQ